MTHTYNDYLCKNRERIACQLTGFWFQSQVKPNMYGIVYFFNLSNFKSIPKKIWDRWCLAMILDLGKDGAWPVALEAEKAQMLICFDNWCLISDKFWMINTLSGWYRKQRSTPTAWTGGFYVIAQTVVLNFALGHSLKIWWKLRIASLGKNLHTHTPSTFCGQFQDVEMG